MAGASSGPPQLATWVITGQSGSGKSTALRALEDQGILCVDNLPRKLVEDLVTYLEHQATVRHLALGLDVREPGVGAEGPALIARLRRRAGGCHVLFLQASIEAMLRRYTTTRRWHPLDDGRGLRAAVVAEMEMLGPLAEVADDHLDTSELTPHALCQVVAGGLGPTRGPPADLRVGVVSFGFKYGVPAEANLVFDVRFLPNPFFDPDLRPKSGEDAAVAAAVLSCAGTQPWLDKALDMLDFVLPRHREEGKRYLHVAVGCTGGRHRSVALAAHLGGLLAARGWPAAVRHRDVAREARPAGGAPGVRELPSS